MSGAIFDLTGSYHAAFINGIAWNLVNVSIAVWLLSRAGGESRPPSASTPLAREESIELIGESLAIGMAERARTARLDASAA